MEQTKDKKLYEKEYFCGKQISNYENYECNKNHPYFKSLLNLILKFKKKGSLLEIGCAYGYFLKHASKNFETYGMDISKYAINKAKKISSNSKLKVGNAEKDLEKFIGDKKFDVIIALDVLEHLKDPEKQIKLFYKFLKKDGILFFKVPNKSSLFFKIYTLIGKKKSWAGYKDETHISLLSQNGWKKILKESGFNYKVVVHTPTKFLKKFFIKNQFFWPAFLNFLNESISFTCIKK